MSLPDRDFLCKALERGDWFESDREAVVAAFEIAVLILPDSDGEWDEKVVDVLAAMIWTRQWPGGKPWSEVEVSQPLFRAHAKAVLAELVRLAEPALDSPEDE